MFCYLGCH
uniref:Uncharacterized protein n=1 Tax=Arundo donax TaxID=35708 RepID=A0A0A9G8D8_ARUDO